MTPAIPEFEMPKVVGVGNGGQRDRASGMGEEALAPYIAPAPPRSPAPPSTHKTPTHVEAIKDRLKQLTHREMRDFVAGIFDAHRKLRTERAPALQNAAAVEDAIHTISSSQLPDVLDKFAYGD